MARNTVIPLIRLSIIIIFQLISITLYLFHTFGQQNAVAS